MKILITGQHFYPEQFKINDIATELVKKGHEVTVLTGLPNYPSGVIPKEYRFGRKRKEVINGVKVKRVWLIPRGKKNSNLMLALNYFSFMISSSIAVFFMKKKYDLVFANQTSPVMMAVPGIVYKKLTGKKVILYCQDIWPECMTVRGVKRGTFVYKLLYKLSRKIYNAADEIFISSQSFADYFKNVLLLDKKMTFMPVYAEDLFGTIHQTDQTDGKLNLLFAGNIGQIQSVETIIKAANELKDHKEIVFHIVGNGSAKEKCEELATSLKVENVIFYGQKPLSDMPLYYSKADAFLITLGKNDLISYTLPNKVQSYMASGKAIVGAIDGETRMVIEQANCGFVCESENYQKLAEQILYLSNHRELLKDFGTNARSYYEQQFSKEKYFEKLESIMIDLVQKD